MDFEANERTTLIDFETFTDDVPTEGTRLIPFRGQLYWGGVKKVWATNRDRSATAG